MVDQRHLGFLETSLMDSILDAARDLFISLFADEHAAMSPGYDVKLIRCCPQYDVKLMWRHRGNDIVSVAAICVAAICAAAQLIFFFGRTRLAV